MCVFWSEVNLCEYLIKFEWVKIWFQMSMSHEWSNQRHHFEWIVLSLLVVNTRGGLLNSSSLHDATIFKSFNYSLDIGGWALSFSNAWRSLIWLSYCLIDVIEVCFPGWVDAIWVLLPLVIHHVNVYCRSSIGKIVQLRLHKVERRLEPMRSWASCHHVESFAFRGSSAELLR